MKDVSEAFVIEAAQQLGLELGPESLAGVLANARILQRMAAEMAAVPLGDDDEPAELLRP